MEEPEQGPLFANKDDNASCGTVTTLTASSVCPVYSVDALTQFLDTYFWLFGTVAIVGGVFFTFLGRKLFMVTLFIVGAMITVFAILIIFYSTFLKDDTASWIGWLVLVLSIILGLGVGWLCTKIARFGAAILAGWGGFMLGVLINEMWLYIYGSQAVFWCVSIALAVIACVLAFIWFNQAIMISTAFIGGYFIARGISAFAGGFPPAFEVVNQVKSGAITTIEPVFYAYVAGIFVFAVVGCIVQFKMFKNMEDKEKHPYDRLQ